MNKSLGLSLIAFFIAVGCQAQIDSLIYYGPNGAISQKKYADTYVRVKSSTNKKSNEPILKLWTYQKSYGEWSEPSSHKELVKENDSIHWIYSVKNKKSTVQVKRTVNTSPNGLYIMDYSPEGTLEQEGYSKSIFPLHRVGLHKSYFPSGALKQNAIYSENEETANQNWDKDGNKLLDNVFNGADMPPVFDGGLEGLRKYLSSAIADPQSVPRRGLSGIVVVTFVVMEDGSIAQAKLLRGIGAKCDEACVKIIQDMPKWIPGSHKGKPIRMRLNQPIRF